jgi:ribosomal-protein-alanine N-acetyltransferase
MEIFRTDRLALRELKASDADAIYQLNHDPGVIRYTSDGPFPTIDEARQFLLNYDAYRSYGYGRWAVIRIADNTFLGWCGLRFSPETGKTDIGFRFQKAFWGLGYATESARGCLEYGFTKLGLPEIVGRAMKVNIASIRVLQKVGMHYDRDFDFDGSEGVLYKIKPADFRA